MNWRRHLSACVTVFAIAGVFGMAGTPAIFGLSLSGLGTPRSAHADGDKGGGNGGGHGHGGDHENDGHGNDGGDGGDHGHGGGNDGGNGKSGGGGSDGSSGSNRSGKADADAGGSETEDDQGDETAGPGTSGQSGAAVQTDRPGAGGDRVVHSEVVVADADDSLSGFAASKGFKVLRSEDLGALGLKVTRLQAPEGVSAARARSIIAQAYPNAVVDFNHVYQPQASMTLPAPDYAVKAVRWSPQLQACGPSPRLGLIDTAVDWSLPILTGARGNGGAFLDSGMQPAPVDHGTGIATLLVGQQGFGLLPQAELYAAGIFGIDADGLPIASATSFAKALNWLLSNDVPTINISLSGPPDRLMQLAVQRAQARGAQLIAAVGNDGTDGVPRFPAAYPGVIGVTAVDQSRQIFDKANKGDFVALAAPGVDLLIPGQPGADGTARDRLVTGTSFAAPYVTATLASYANDRQRMLADAIDLGAPGPDPVYGRGLVQAPAVCMAATASQ